MGIIRQSDAEHGRALVDRMFELPRPSPEWEQALADLRVWSMERPADHSRGAVTPSEIVKWLRGRTGAHGGGFTSADDVADAIEREFTDAR